MGACASPVLAQSNQALRDSLAHATDILAYHPDSIDLRLKEYPVGTMELCEG